VTDLLIADVAYSYKHVAALRDLSLRLAGPGIVGLLGPNGAGKTTLIKILATVFRPQAGSVLLEGIPLSGAGRLHTYRRRLGYVPQDDVVWDGFTVSESVRYVGWLREMTAESTAGNLHRSLGWVGIGDLSDRKVRTLSGGQKRRLSIAQSLVNDPEVLLMDEPTAGLDPEQRIQFRGVLREVGKSALVIVSTHLIEDVVAACDRVAIMTGGRVVYTGTPAQLEAVGDGGGDGQSAAERGYLAALGQAGSGS
jgi:ABC-type multidrug transport system ATPase subunit